MTRRCLLLVARPAEAAVAVEVAAVPDVVVAAVVPRVLKVRLRRVRKALLVAARLRAKRVESLPTNSERPALVRAAEEAEEAEEVVAGALGARVAVR
jgi:hypothetical protein